MLQNFLWCEIQRILISCKRKVTDTVRTNYIRRVTTRFKWRFRLTRLRSSQSKTTPSRPTQTRAICTESTTTSTTRGTKPAITRCGNCTYTSIWIRSQRQIRTHCQILRNAGITEFLFSQHVSRWSEFIPRNLEFTGMWQMGNCMLRRIHRLTEIAIWKLVPKTTRSENNLVQMDTCSEIWWLI